MAQPEYRKVAEGIRRWIAAKEVKVGDQLPSHTELEAQYNATVGVVRRALVDLRVEGLIETLPGKGSFILKKPGKPAPASQVADFMRRFDELQATVRRLDERLEQLERRQSQGHPSDAPCESPVRTDQPVVS